MALDHNRIRPRKQILGKQNKSGPIFCVRQVYFTKSWQQIWGCVNQPFLLLINRIWGQTALLIIQTSDRMHYFTIFQDKLRSVNIQDDQSLAFSETVQKISKVTYTASRFSLLKNFQCERSPVFESTLTEVSFNIIKNLSRLFFSFNDFISMCNQLILKSVWYARHFV